MNRMPASLDVVIVEFTCLLCGRPITDVQLSPSSNAAARLFLHLDWSRRRCQACGGTAIASDVRPGRRPEPPVDWTADRPRRGRPPKHLADDHEKEEKEC